MTGMSATDQPDDTMSFVLCILQAEGSGMHRVPGPAAGGQLSSGGCVSAAASAAILARTSACVLECWS